MTCIYDNEPVVVKGKQLCAKHYYRLRKYNDPNFTKAPGATKDNRYWSWHSMRHRVLFENHPYYRYYGGKGVKICDRWLGPNGFKNFCDDMGPRPSSAYSLDRIDSTGDYEPGNCKWSTRFEQQNNLSNNRKVPGVRPNGKRWIADICIDGVRYHKSFKTEEEAIAQRREYERKYVKVPA